MRVLVTRPAAAAAALAARLAARGHEATIEPLLTIIGDPDASDRLAPALEGAQAVLVTSANGVDALAAATPRRDIRIFAVGDASAAAARAAGFSAVESASGDVASLAALVAARLKPDDGPLVHGSGHDVAGDLAGTLAGAGFVVRPVALYRAEVATELSPAVIALMRSGGIDAVLFFSPRTAGTFVRLAAATGLQAPCAGMAAVALSPAVAAALGALTWQRLVVADEPTETALLEALDRLAIAPAAGKQDHTMSDGHIEIEGTAVTPSEPAAAEPLPPAAARERSPRMRRLVAALVLLNVALVAALASAPYWAPRFAGESDGAGVAALQAKLDALQGRLAEADQTRQRLAAAEQRLASVEARGPSAGAPRDAQQAAQQTQILGQLADRLAILEQRVTSLDTTSGGAAAEATKSLATETQALAHRLDEQAQALTRLQATQAQSPDRTDAALLLAVDQLHQAIQTSRPFEVELATATALARDRPDAVAALAPLQARAAQGLPGIAVLAERLELLAPALTAVAAAPADDDWRSEVLAKIKNLVSVRRVGSRAAAEGGGTEAALAAAEAALKAGDLAGAVAAMRKLDGTAAETAKPWLGDAEARLAAEAAVASLDATLARRFLSDQPAKP